MDELEKRHALLAEVQNLYIKLGRNSHGGLMRYTQQTAPLAIKIAMDHEAEPLWISEPHSADMAAYINTSVDAIAGLDPIIKHVLNTYRRAWETAYASKYIALESLEDEFDANPQLSEAIKQSLRVLGQACENALERWLTENGWATTLCRQKHFD